MALDPRVILGIQPTKTSTAGESMTRVLDQRAQQEKLQQQADAQREQSDVRAIFQQTQGDPEQTLTLMRQRAPQAAMKYEDELTKQRKARADALKVDLDNEKAHTDLGLRILQGIRDEASYQIALPHLKQFEFGPMLPANFDPDALGKLGEMGLTAKDYADKQKDGLERILKGEWRQGIGTVLSTAMDEDDWQEMRAGFKELGVPASELALFPPNFSPDAAKQAARLTMSPNERADNETARLNAETAAANAKKETGYTLGPGQVRFDTNNQRVASGLPPHVPVSSRGGGGGGSNNVKDAVQGMIEGTIPPQLPGRASKDYLAILGESKRRGYNLAQAVEDWTATQKHLSTLNGAQQERLRQAVTFTRDSLDVVERLAKEWKGGRFPLLNTAQLKLAKGGAFGAAAQSLATRLESQVNDLVSELGTVYKGGNGSTDESLKLAASNLKADWSEKTLLDNITQVRQNLRIRENSIKNSGVAGASASNPYAAPSVQPRRYNPQTGKVE